MYIVFINYKNNTSNIQKLIPSFEKTDFCGFLIDNFMKKNIDRILLDDNQFIQKDTHMHDFYI